MTQKAVYQAARSTSGYGVFAFGLNEFIQGEADVTQDGNTLSARGLNFAADDTPARFGVFMENRSQQGSGVMAEIWTRPAGYEFTQQAGDTLQATGTVATLGTFGWMWDLPSLDADGELPAEGTLSVTQDDNTIFARGLIITTGGATVQQDNQTLQATGTVTDAETPDTTDRDGETWEAVTRATTTWTRV